MMDLFSWEAGVVGVAGPEIELFMSNRMAAIGNTIPEQTKHTPLFIIQPNLCQCNAYTITCLLQIAFRCFRVAIGFDSHHPLLGSSFK